MSKPQQEQENRILLTQAQKNALGVRAMRMQTAQMEVNGFVGYLMEEYNLQASDGWMVTQDLTAFVKVEQPPMQEVAEPGQGVEPKQNE